MIIPIFLGFLSLAYYRTWIHTPDIGEAESAIGNGIVAIAQQLASYKHTGSLSVFGFLESLEARPSGKLDTCMRGLALFMTKRGKGSWRGGALALILPPC
jgi:hypothetical protein